MGGWGWVGGIQVGYVCEQEDDKGMKYEHFCKQTNERTNKQNKNKKGMGGGGGGRVERCGQ